jgi:hypothetical protein
MFRMFGPIGAAVYWGPFFVLPNGSDEEALAFGYRQKENTVVKMFRAFSLALCAALITPALTKADVETQDVQIVDPVFSMTAYTLSAPAGWHIEGTVLPPASCDAITPLIFRATSPDGLAGRYRLPSISWAWGAGVHPKADCNLAQQNISAADFLTYYARHAHVGYVKTIDVPDAQQSLHPGQTIDQAAMLARYSVGKRQMEEMLRDTVICTASTSVGIGESHVCNATVVRSYAPLGKLDALLPTFDLFKGRVNDEWMSAWTNAMRQRVNNLYEHQTAAMLRQGELAGAQRMQAHKDYMASMQAGADRRDIQFEEGQYRKQNNSDNYVDYILDCQRAYVGDVRISSSNCPNRQTP